MTPRIVHEEETGKTEHGAIAEASDLGWGPADWPVQIEFVTVEKRQVFLRYEQSIEHMTGGLAAVVYADKERSFFLEVLND